MVVIAISDVHLERRRLEEVTALTKACSTVDVWEGESEKAVRGVAELAGKKRAKLVPGNHDLHSLRRRGHTILDLLKRMRSEADRQNAQARREIVTVLRADNPVCEIERVRFIGLTFLSDCAQAGRWMSAASGMEWSARAHAAASHPKGCPREVRAIRTERGGWTPYDAVAEHAREKAIVLDQLVVSHDGSTVVVVHYPSVAECVDAYQTLAIPWWAPAFYTSDLLPTIPDELRPNLWICSHVHAPFDAQLGQTCAVCNPVEGGKFNPNLMIEIQ